MAFCFSFAVSPISLSPPLLLGQFPPILGVCDLRPDTGISPAVSLSLRVRGPSTHTPCTFSIKSEPRNDSSHGAGVWISAASHWGKGTLHLCLLLLHEALTLPSERPLLNQHTTTHGESKPEGVQLQRDCQTQTGLDSQFIMQNNSAAVLKRFLT